MILHITKIPVPIKKKKNDIKRINISMLYNLGSLER